MYQGLETTRLEPPLAPYPLLLLLLPLLLLLLLLLLLPLFLLLPFRSVEVVVMPVLLEVVSS